MLFRRTITFHAAKQTTDRVIVDEMPQQKFGDPNNWGPRAWALLLTQLWPQRSKPRHFKLRLYIAKHCNHVKHAA